jgi:hypothetical protein
MKTDYRVFFFSSILLLLLAAMFNAVTPNALQKLQVSSNKRFFDAPGATANGNDRVLILDSSTKLTTGLVGLWSFNGPDIYGTTAYDRSGEGNHGTLTKGPTPTMGNNGTLTDGPTPTIGKIGQALYFDGVDDRVSITDSSSLKPTSALTVSAWVKLARASASKAVIFDHFSGSPYYGYGLQLRDGGHFAFKVAYNVNGLTPVSNNTLPIGQWVHLLGTWDGSDYTMYFNGALDKTGAMAGPLSYTESVNPTIGRRAISATQLFNGSIDDVRVYNRALSATEAQELYNIGR